MKRTSKVNAFLIEMVVVILFFAVSSAVALQLFVAAHQKSEQSQRTSVAMVQLQSMAEQIKGLPVLNEEALQSLPYCGGIQLRDKEAEKTVAIDKNWEQADGQSADGYVSIRLQTEPFQAGEMLVATLSAGRLQGANKAEPFYELTTKTYFPTIAQ